VTAPCIRKGTYSTGPTSARRTAPYLEETKCCVLGTELALAHSQQLATTRNSKRGISRDAKPPQTAANLLEQRSAPHRTTPECSPFLVAARTATPAVAPPHHHRHGCACSRDWTSAVARSFAAATSEGRASRCLCNQRTAAFPPHSLLHHPGPRPRLDRLRVERHLLATPSPPLSTTAGPARRNP
jgi:hypothetical protein